MSDYTVRYRIGVDTADSAEKLDKVTRAGEHADKKLKQVSNTTAGGSGSATNALTNFNRVVQDAPFGLIGVANNIDPLFASFQKLKQETGSTGGAFKALSGTLAGPTGVLFGVSLVVTALQVLPGLLAKTAGAAQKMNKELAQVGATAKAEQIQILALSSSLLNNNYSMEQRKSVLKEIQKINPDYLKNLKLEKVTFDQLQVKIKEANKALAIKTEITIGYAQIAALAKKAADIEVEMMYETPDTVDWINSLMKNGLGTSAGTLMGTVSETALRGITMLEKLNARIKEITDRTSKLSYQGLEVTPETKPTVEPDNKKNAKEVVDLLMELILESMTENRRRMDESLAARSTRLSDRRNLPTALDPTWRGRSLGDLSLSGYDPRTDAIDSSVSAEVRVVKMDTAYQKLFKTLSKTLNLSINLTKAFDSAGDAVANEIGGSITVFKEANSLLEIFINSLVRAAAQAISLSVIRSAFSLLGGNIPFLSFLMPGAGPASGGGSMPMTGYSTRELIANRKTIVELAPVEFKQSGYDLRAVVLAANKKIAYER